MQAIEKNGLSSPSYKPIEAAKATTNALWELGIPPVLKNNERFTLPVVKSPINTLAAWAVRQEIMAIHR